MKYQTVIFDLDGTTLNTEAILMASVRHTMRKLSLPDRTDKQLRFFIGPTLEESFSKVFDLHGADNTHAIAVFRQFYRDNSARYTTLYPGVTELLELLHKAGVKIAAATMKYEPYAVQSLVDLKIMQYFDAVAGHTDTPDETKAGMVEKCLAQLEMPKKSAVLVGDTVYDAQGAMEAGIDFIAVSYGFGFENGVDRDRYPCRHIVDSMADLATYLQE